jgi:DNA sulfur modification protein DndE
MQIEQIRLSQAGKEQLVLLKRRTKIKNWNVLCRWAFCRSLAEETKPSPVPIPSDSSVEMTWKTFAGPHAAIYLGLLKARCKNDGIELTSEHLNKHFRLHLHRGIAYLAGDKNLQYIEDLAMVAVSRA